MDEDEDFKVDDDGLAALSDDDEAEAEGEPLNPADAPTEGSIWTDSDGLLGPNTLYVFYSSQWKSCPRTKGGWTGARDVPQKLLDIVTPTLVEVEDRDKVAELIGLPAVEPDEKLAPADLALRRFHRKCFDLAQRKRQRAEARGKKVKRTPAQIKADAALLR